MDLYRDENETGASAADTHAQRRSPASGLRAALCVVAVVAIMGAGAAFVAFQIRGVTGSDAATRRAASPSPQEIASPAVRGPVIAPSGARLAATVENPDAYAASSTRPRVEVYGGVNIEDTADWRVAPRLKPSLAANAVREAARTPAITATEPQSALAADPPPASGRAMALGQRFLASRDDRPPSAFYLQDAIADRTPPPPIPVAYARDFGSGPRSVDVALQRGETFVDALRRAGVRAEDRNAAAAAFGAHQNMRLMRPGQRLALTVAEPNETLFQSAALRSEPRDHLLGLEFRPGPGERLVLRRSRDGGFAAEKKAVPLTARLVSIAGVINGSLYQSAKRVGAPDEVIAQLANVFAYDVDFQREINGGDEFEALFEVRYDESGSVVSASDVIYARLKWKNRSKEKGYYRFVAADGTAEYFDRSGESAKRLLMKTPIDGARLSSRFGSRRHPILGYMKRHQGVDFAAPTGTPIKAAGDGVVERAGPYSSFGNYVRIKHNSGYKTAYAHLSRFAKGMKAGRRVRQGDVIGYVGTTGRSTGPHLHYEVHHKDKPVNPQNLKVATGIELFGADLKRFKASREAIDAMRPPAPRPAQDDSKRASL